MTSLLQHRYNTRLDPPHNLPSDEVTEWKCKRDTVTVQRILSWSYTRLHVADLWCRIVIVLSVRLTTTCGPSFVAYSGGRGASFRTKTRVKFCSRFVGRMDPERVRRWSLRAAAFAGSDSAKKTPDRRNAAAI
ncbi:conserved hypothetical protein [Trichinella spiralis]|uniref:hypothetical protein n=1 Tax=Trichinella spiralis TaxID=6334 RepID=UPI0001EFBC46|nr:conserved hypothetical protein [Trichinella spiralis]